MVCLAQTDPPVRQADIPVFPLRPVHASHDMITLLNLQGLYNTHVRPYAANQDDGGSDEEAGQIGNKRRRIKIEKGYQHLLPDCIGQSRPPEMSTELIEDPVPAGDKSGVALLPLLGDFGNPPGPGPELPEGPLGMLGMDVFQSARLEPGTQKGVSYIIPASVQELTSSIKEVKRLVSKKQKQDDGYVPRQGHH